MGAVDQFHKWCSRFDGGAPSSKEKWPHSSPPSSESIDTRLPASLRPGIGIGADAARNGEGCGGGGASSSPIETWRTRGPGEATGVCRFLSRSFGSLRGLRPVSRPVGRRAVRRSSTRTATPSSSLRRP